MHSDWKGIFFIINCWKLEKLFFHNIIVRNWLISSDALGKEGKGRKNTFSEQRHQLMTLLNENSCSLQTNLKFWFKFLPHAAYLPELSLSEHHLLHPLQHSFCLLVPISARYWEISQRIIESKAKLLLMLFTWKMVYSHRKQELYQILVENSVGKSSYLIFKCTLVIFIYS